jgi:GGDEF domain-containing protein
VEGNREDLESFRAAIAGLQTSLQQNPSPENILLATGSAVGALQNYNKRTSQFIRAKAVELQAIVAMLMQAMSQIANGSRNSIARLQEIQEEIEHAAMLEDVRAVKARLSDCLQSIRREAARQRDESANAVSTLKEGLRQAKETKPVQVAESCDPVTGLPPHADAEAAIAAACEGGSKVYAALFVVERIQPINSRFGRSVGDQVLVMFLQHLSQALTPADRLYRWNEASFLGLLERHGSADQVRKELGKILSRRHTFEIDSRSVVLPVASTWVVALLFKSSYAEILHKLDSFIEALHKP